MDKEYIKSLVQEIIDKEFSDPTRRKIIDFNNRLNFCAPCCGDSHKNKHAKRGNLYFDKLLYVCFNCGTKSSLDHICKDFNVRIDPSKKMELIEHMNNNVTYNDYEDSILDNGLKYLLDLEEVIESINNNFELSLKDVTPIKKNSIVYNYLVNRGISEELHTNIYQGKNYLGSERYENVICLLNKNKNKILSIQIRNLKEGKNRNFKIFNFETLYLWTKGNIDDIDVNTVAIYNKISYFFNILNVDFSKKVTIFEGYLDSLFFPNSIGVVGTNTDMRFLEDNNIDIQYFYDNDNSGNIKSVEKIKMGYKVFLWNKLFEYIVRMKSKSDPYKLYQKISSVKDLNKLATFVSNPYSTYKMNNFFSKDIYDIKYINKLKRVFTK